MSQDKISPRSNTISQEPLAVLELAHKLVEGPLLEALTAAYDAGYDAKPDMLEDDEHAAEMRRVLLRLKALTEEDRDEWFLRQVAERYDICTLQRVNGRASFRTVVSNVSKETAEKFVLLHNHISKIILLAQKGLDARAAGQF